MFVINIMSWKGVKNQTNIENIKDWCEEMGIQKYTINSKGEIDVNGNVILDAKGIVELPYKFGKVEGFFDVGDNKNLISLKNCPTYVKNYMRCNHCHNLYSLKGCPQEVGWTFYCNGNINIKSLEGCPEKVGGNFYCKGCKRKFTEKEVKSLCRVKGDIIN